MAHGHCPSEKRPVDEYWPRVESFVGPIGFGDLLCQLGHTPSAREMAVASELARMTSSPDLVADCRDLAAERPDDPGAWVLLGAAARMLEPGAAVTVGRKSTAWAITLGEIVGLFETGQTVELAKLCTDNVALLGTAARAGTGALVLGHAVCSLLPSHTDAARSLLQAAPRPFVGWQVAVGEVVETASRLMDDHSRLADADELLEVMIDRLDAWSALSAPGEHAATVSGERSRLVVLRARAARKAGKLRTAERLLHGLDDNVSESVRVAALREQILVGARLIEASSLTFPVTVPDHVVLFEQLKPLEGLLHQLLERRPLDPVARLLHGVLAMVTDKNLAAMLNLTCAARCRPEDWEGTFPPSFAELLTHMALAYMRSPDPGAVRYGTETLLQLLDWECELSPRALAEACTYVELAGPFHASLLFDAFTEATGFSREGMVLLRVLFNGKMIGSREPTDQELQHILAAVPGSPSSEQQ